MPDVAIQTALANEARRQELRSKVAMLRGAAGAASRVAAALNQISTENSQLLSDAQTELRSLELGAGPGVTDDFGPKSPITQMLETERFAAKSACVDFIKANPTCTAEEAIAEWTNAAIATHPTLPMPLQDGAAIQALYASRLQQLGLTTAATWEAHRGWIVATPKDTIMGL